MNHRPVLREWIILKHEYFFYFTLGAFIFLAWVALWNGASRVERQKQAMVHAKQQGDEAKKSLEEFYAIASSRPQSGILPWHAGIASFHLWPVNTLPPASLQHIAVGQSDIYPDSFQARTAFDAVNAQQEIRNPLDLLTGYFDIVFLIVYFLPLLVIANNYNVLSAEREVRILPLLLSQPIESKNLLLDKLTLRYLFFVGAVGVITIIVALYSDGFMKDTLFGLACFLIIVSAYLLFWFLVVFWIVGHGWNGLTNAFILVNIWVALALIAPGLGNVVIDTFNKKPQELALVQSIQHLNEELVENGELILKKYYRDNRADDLNPSIKFDDYWTQRYAIDREMEKRLKPQFIELERVVQRRAMMEEYSNFLSPALLVNRMLVDLAGTGEKRYSHFKQQLDLFREQWRALFEPRIFAQKGFPKQEWHMVPGWTFHEEATGVVLKRLLLPITALIGLNAVMLFLSIRVWRKCVVWVQ